jgi:hypothetical protein
MRSTMLTDLNVAFLPQFLEQNVAIILCFLPVCMVLTVHIPLLQFVLLHLSSIKITAYEKQLRARL